MDLDHFLLAVKNERHRQFRKYGNRPLPLHVTLNTLMRELGEVHDAVSALYWGKESRYKLSREEAQRQIIIELIQVAAVCHHVINDSVELADAPEFLVFELVEQG